MGGGLYHKEASLRHEVKIMVGGAPVTQRFANDIGADGYAENAGEAAERMKTLLREAS